MNDIVQRTDNSVLSAEDMELLKQAGQQFPTEIDKKNLAMPWLRIVQSMSGYVKEDDPQYLPDAKEGHIIDTVSLKLRKKVGFIPVALETNYTEWKKKRSTSNSIPVKSYFTDSSAYDALPGTFGPRTASESAETEIVPTEDYYGIAVDEDGVAIECILSFGGTQAKKSRRLAQLLDMRIDHDHDGKPFKPPIFNSSFVLTTVREKNDQGAWMGWKIQPGNKVMGTPEGNKLFRQAMEMRKRYDKGELRAVLTPAAASGAAQDRANATGTDEIPF